MAVRLSDREPGDWMHVAGKKYKKSRTARPRCRSLGATKTQGCCPTDPQAGSRKVTPAVDERTLRDLAALLAGVTRIIGAAQLEPDQYSLDGTELGDVVLVALDRIHDGLERLADDQRSR